MDWGPTAVRRARVSGATAGAEARPSALITAAKAEQGRAFRSFNLFRAATAKDFVLNIPSSAPTGASEDMYLYVLLICVPSY